MQRWFLMALLLVAAAPYPSDIPANFRPADQDFDFVKRIVLIPMRDGAKLNTVILLPRAGSRTPGGLRAPMLIERTPYGAEKAAQRSASPHLAANLRSGDDIIAVSGYIRVFQDVRGKYGSDGDYVMNRPLCRPAQPHPGRSRHRYV